MQRRTFVTTVGAISTVGLAGCTEELDDANTDSGNGNSNGQEDEEETEQDRNTVHEVGDTFVVGDSRQQIEYTVTAARLFEDLGDQYLNTEPDGYFLVVELRMTNQTDESFSISTNSFSVSDSQGRRFDPDSGAGMYIDTDPRIESEGILFKQLNPGLTTQGALVFDVSPNDTVSLVIEPTAFLESGETHTVRLGNT